MLFLEAMLGVILLAAAAESHLGATLEAIFQLHVPHCSLGLEVAIGFKVQHGNPPPNKDWLTKKEGKAE